MSDILSTLKLPKAAAAAAIEPRTRVSLDRTHPLNIMHPLQQTPTLLLIYIARCQSINIINYK